MSFDVFKKTVFIRVWGFLKVPMIAWLRPRVIEMSDNRVEISIPLSRRSKNHFDAMYFGALAAGADIAAGITAMAQIEKSPHKISFAFKSLKADFLKRAESNTHFICNSPGAVSELVDKAIKSGQREQLAVKVDAFCPQKLGDEPVARFELVLSIKKKS